MKYIKHTRINWKEGKENKRKPRNPMGEKKDDKNILIKKYENKNITQKMEIM